MERCDPPRTSDGDICLVLGNGWNGLLYYDCGNKKDDQIPKIWTNALEMVWLVLHLLQWVAF